MPVISFLQNWKKFTGTKVIDAMHNVLWTTVRRPLFSECNNMTRKHNFWSFTILQQRNILKIYSIILRWHIIPYFTLQDVYNTAMPFSKIFEFIAHTTLYQKQKNASFSFSLFCLNWLMTSDGHIMNSDLHQILHT